VKLLIRGIVAVGLVILGFTQVGGVSFVAAPFSGNVALVPPAFVQEGVKVEWRFLREKVDPVT
jgi:hypothetical protein